MKTTLLACAPGTAARGGAGECCRNAFDHDLGKGTVALPVGKTF